MRALPAFAILGLAALLARPVAAQGTDPAAATALYREGREAAKAGDYETACVKLQESLRLDFGVGTLLNLADCREHRGQLATAWQLFQQAADQSPVTDKRRATAQQRVAALEARLPRLAVTLAPDAPPETRVIRDGVTLGNGSLGAALPVDPGAHLVVVQAPGRADARYPVEMAEAQTERLVVAPGAPAPIAPTPSVPAPSVPVPSVPAPSAPPGRSRLQIAGFVVGGAGLASLGAAVATGLVLPSRQRTVDQHCGASAHLPTDGCDAVGFAAAQSGKTLAAANTATWIVGGLATAAGVALVIVGSVGHDRPGAAVQVGASAGGLGVSLQGRFE